MTGKGHFAQQNESRPQRRGAHAGNIPHFQRAAGQNPAQGWDSSYWSKVIRLYTAIDGRVLGPTHFRRGYAGACLDLGHRHLGIAFGGASRLLWPARSGAGDVS